MHWITTVMKMQYSSGSVFLLKVLWYIMISCLLHMCKHFLIVSIYIFLAPTDSTLFLLANCYYQSGRKCQAYKFFRNKGYPTARCKYLYSKCCFDMGKYVWWIRLRSLKLSVNTRCCYHCILFEYQTWWGRVCADWWCDFQIQSAGRFCIWVWRYCIVCHQSPCRHI